MAQPTKRVLDWASGGTTTDPGGAKESAGWLVSEKPPANWWNWILQSFGDWLKYFKEDTMPIVACGYVQNSGTLVWSKNTTGVDNTTIADTVVIQIAETFAGDNMMPIVQMIGGPGAGYHYATSASIVSDEFIYVHFGSTLGTGGSDLDPDPGDFDFYYALVGPIT